MDETKRVLDRDRSRDAQAVGGEDVLANAKGGLVADAPVPDLARPDELANRLHLLLKGRGLSLLLDVVLRLPAW